MPGEAADIQLRRRRRYIIYALLALHQMANYVTRLALPFMIPFLVNDFSFSEVSRALFLNAFTPGYVLLQIPAGMFEPQPRKRPLV